MLNCILTFARQNNYKPFSYGTKNILQCISTLAGMQRTLTNCYAAKQVTTHLQNLFGRPIYEFMVTFVPDVVVSNGGGGGGSNGVMEEGDRLITVDLSDDSPGTSGSGESGTRLTEDVTPGTGPETEMVDFVGRQKKPLKKRPVLTVSFGHGHCQTLCLSSKRVKSRGSAVLHALKGMCKGNVNRAQ